MIDAILCVFLTDKRLFKAGRLFLHRIWYFPLFFCVVTKKYKGQMLFCQTTRPITKFGTLTNSLGFSGTELVQSLPGGQLGAGNPVPTRRFE